MADGFNAAQAILEQMQQEAAAGTQPNDDTPRRVKLGDRELDLDPEAISREFAEREQRHQDELGTLKAAVEEMRKYVSPETSRRQNEAPLPTKPKGMSVQEWAELTARDPGEATDRLFAQRLGLEDGKGIKDVVAAIVAEIQGLKQSVTQKDQQLGNLAVQHAQQRFLDSNAEFAELDETGRTEAAKPIADIIKERGWRWDDARSYQDAYVLAKAAGRIKLPEGGGDEPEPVTPVRRGVPSLRRTQGAPDQDPSALFDDLDKKPMSEVVKFIERFRQQGG